MTDILYQLEERRKGMEDVNRTLGILLAGQENLRNDVATLTKYLVGNGQPGLLFTVKELKTNLENHIVISEQTFSDIECWQIKHDNAMVDMKNLKETRSWDLKRIVLTACITFALSTVASAFFNYFIMERMIKVVVATATATPIP